MASARVQRAKSTRAGPARRPGDLARGIEFPVVAIGASAGGLEAMTKLVEALPAGSGMAFILVQHLEPSHQSMLVGLLAGHTSMPVLEATDALAVERDHIYIIPPACYLSIGGGALHLTRPADRHGARLPFDFLLNSLAEACGPRAICVVLSGTGADGSAGLLAIKRGLGRVIVQDPEEADYDGMPRSAIATGGVDQILRVGLIPAALAEQPPADRVAPGEQLTEILELLRARTVHDFTLYKPGTLQRRIERRMAMASLGRGEMGPYLAKLRSDPGELDRLAKDLLIHVTGFFRDPAVFKILGDATVPDLLGKLPPDHQLRIWIAGCSTGEEAYSLGMLIRELIAAAPAASAVSSIKLQIFASDADADAIATAREGFYPAGIAADVSAERLARFFVKEDQGYRIVPELRACVVFTVQDVLTDPPFSRLDLVSCRNLLIYLGVKAQAKVISMFHFALNEGGILLLGSAETIGDASDRFELVSKTARVFRHIGRSRPGDFEFSGTTALRVPERPGRSEMPSRQSVLSGLCTRHILDAYAPATIISNRKHEYLHSAGPIQRYLQVAPGQPTQDLLAMARDDTRSRLRLAIERAYEENAAVNVPGGRTTSDGISVPFSIAVQPVLQDGERLVLICFVDGPGHAAGEPGTEHPQNAPVVAELARELETTRTELQSAIRNLEMSSQEQKAINEEALSINEEFQSTNEELLTSKEELQSLNEELTALNSQLQDTLEQQRTTANDLQNVLYSTDVATLFLDTALRIRFFTPATRSLFNVVKADLGRPLADLRSLAADDMLSADATEVLKTLEPSEREIETPDGIWFRRRILPYRTHDDGVEGVVITFTDVTRRKHTAKALEAAKLDAELANKAKSRFLAAASHDLRQPLQTLALLQGLLAAGVEGDRNRKLVSRLDETLGAMSSMLNTLLDIDQIEGGIVKAELTTFCIGDLLDRMKDEFTYLAQAQGLSLRIVRSSALVSSDPRLLEQMMRNLLSNALKYTKSGKVLVGCRRRGEILSIEILDTGIGIADSELGAIFGEYHQLDNPARERSRGLGLGLAIVQRLATLLDHRVRVNSRPGKGSVFSIEIKTARDHVAEDAGASGVVATVGTGRSAQILLIEDDPELRDLLDIVLTQQGHHVHRVADGAAAIEHVMSGAASPDLIVSDFNLPNGLDGVRVAARLLAQMHAEIPVIILTGDISSETSRSVALQGYTQLNKPVKPAELTRSIQSLLATSKPIRHEDVGIAAKLRTIFVVDDDRNVRRALCDALEQHGHTVQDYAESEAFLAEYRPGHDGCLLIDAYLPGMSGLELLQQLRRRGDRLPTIMITGNSDVHMAVQAMQAGASDFIEKPVVTRDLLASIDRAFEQSQDVAKLTKWRESARSHLAGLTPRQREVMDLVLAGHPSKNIAADIGISQRTVENHRASIMRKTGARSLPALARLALAATERAGAEPDGTGDLAA